MRGAEAGDGPRWLAWLLVPISLLSDPLAALPRLSYYFRDFTLTFYPLRSFGAEELALGRLPAWNPFVNEGTFALPALYPPDLLHVFASGPVAVSWLLTMHLPVAALTFYALARGLGASRFGALAGGAVYALGGFGLSSLNLYVFLQALALGPAVALALLRAGERGGRATVVAALVVALSLSTLALEFVAQAILVGGALGLVAAPRRALPRLATGLGLAAGLAAIPIALVAGILPETARGEGLPGVEALSHAVHPVTLLQVVLPGLFGSLSSPLEHWWGGRFFTGGFPYFTSLYLGPLAVGFAVAGAPALPARHRRILLVLAGLALWYALGPWGGLSPALVSWPGFRSFRFPSKALLLPYLVACVLIAFGAERLRRGDGWRALAWTSGVVLFVAAAIATGVWAFPAPLGDWLALSPRVAAEMARGIPLEAGRAAVIAAVAVGLAWKVGRGEVASTRAAVLLVGLAVADLAQAGAGMNPQAPRQFFDLLPEIRALALDRLAGGRVFSYGVKESPAFRGFLEARGPGTGLWSFFVNRQTLSPFNNVVDRVETAEGIDRTSFLANAPILGPGAYDPGAVEAILPVLRNAAVSRIVSLDPLASPELRLAVQAPAGPPGLAVRVYEVADPWPRAYVACRVVIEANRDRALVRPLEAGFDPRRDVLLEPGASAECREASVTSIGGGGGSPVYDVVADAPGYLVSRDSFARGWTARVDGEPAPVLRANGKHRAVPVGAGRHRVALTYTPPGLRAGVLVTAVAILLAIALWRLAGSGLESPPLPTKVAD